MTSIIEGIQAGDDVWGSGTKTVKEADGSYTVTGAGAGEGTWGGNIAAIPVCFSAGDLVGFSHIVAEVDISGFTLNEDSERHPAIELKIANDDDKKVKIINATKLLKNNKIEIPLADVEADILKDASKVMLSFRGSGTVKVKNISKAKEKATTAKPDDTVTTKPDSTKDPDDTNDSAKDDTAKDKDLVEDDKKDEDTKPEDPKPETSAEPTVIYKLDFSGETLPENDYDGIADSQGAVEFKAKEGLSITGGWKSFGIVPKGISEKDFSTANYIKVTFKCSEDATFEKDNNRLMVAVYNTDTSYADTNFSWTAFFDKGNDDDIPTKFETVEKEIKWEQKYDENGKALPVADTSKINGFRIWTQAFTGTLTVQSIEFIKK